jgi:hypothetical protein
MIRERNRAGKIDNYITALKSVHEQFSYPYPLEKLQDIKIKTLENKIKKNDLSNDNDSQKNIFCNINIIDSRLKNISSTDMDLYPYSTSNINNVDIPYSQGLDFGCSKQHNIIDGIIIL